MRAILGCESSSIVLLLCGMTLIPAATPAGTRQVLAEFETGASKPMAGASDRMVGSRNEISRFQILPSGSAQRADLQHHIAMRHLRHDCLYPLMRFQ